jgi:VanZ family protein
MRHTLSKYLSWLPSILIAAAIFSFSSQTADASTATSDRVSQMLLVLANELHIIDIKGIDVEQMCISMATVVRKSAHTFEFSALHLSLLYALRQWDFRGKRWLRTALFTTVGYACTDEFHQLFVPGRAGLITDVLIDSIGAVFITLILHLYMNRQRIKAMDKYR